MRGQRISRQSSNDTDDNSERPNISRRPQLFGEDEDAEADEFLFLLKEKEMQSSYLEDKKNFLKKQSDGTAFSPASSVFQFLGKQINKDQSSIPEQEDSCSYTSFDFGGGRRSPGFKNWRDLETKKSNQYFPKEVEYKILSTSGKVKKDSSIFSAIYSFLLRRKRPAHIDNVISYLQKVNVLGKDTNHIYSTVYRTFTRNVSVFIKTDKATFSLRDGFFKTAKKPPIVVSPEVKLEEAEEDDTEVDTEVANNSLQQLVIMSAKQLSGNETICPANVFQDLKRFGFNGTYKSIYKAMQSSKFIKTGFNYRLTNE